MSEAGHTFFDERLWRCASRLLMPAVAILLMSGCGRYRNVRHPSSTSTDGELRISVTVDAEVADIAQPVHLTVAATAPAGTVVSFPDLGERVGALFIVGVRDSVGAIVDGLKEESRTWLVEGYAAGRATIPTLEVAFDQPEARSVNILRSEPLVLRIRSAAGLFAHPANYRDITEVVELPHGWAYWTLRIGGGLLLVALLLFLAALISRRMLARTTPETRAQRRLDRLNEQRLEKDWSPERVLAESTAVLRRYVAERFGIDSPHLTTQECLERVSREPALTPAQRDALQAFLDRSDLAKFAHWVPSLDDARTAIAEVRQIVAGADSSHTRPHGPRKRRAAHV